VFGTYKDTIDLEPSETYCFEIVDVWADGIISPRGLYKLYKDNHTMFAQNYEIKVFGDRVFFQTTLPAASSALSPVEEATVRIAISSDRKTLEIVFNSLAGGQATISLYSIEGKRLLNSAVPSTAGICTAMVSLPVLSPGIYLLNISRKEKSEIIKIRI
jgi:hypothetical protein